MFLQDLFHFVSFVSCAASFCFFFRRSLPFQDGLSEMQNGGRAEDGEGLVANTAEATESTETTCSDLKVGYPVMTCFVLFSFSYLRRALLFYCIVSIFASTCFPNLPFSSSSHLLPLFPISFLSTLPFYHFFCWDALAQIGTRLHTMLAKQPDRAVAGSVCQHRREGEQGIPYRMKKLGNK